MIIVLMSILIIMFASFHKFYPISTSCEADEIRKTNFDKQFSSEDYILIKKELNLIDINKLSDDEMLYFLKKLDAKLGDSEIANQIQGLTISQIRYAIKELKRILNNIQFSPKQFLSTEQILDKSQTNLEKISESNIVKSHKIKEPIKVDYIDYENENIQYLKDKSLKPGIYWSEMIDCQTSYNLKLCKHKLYKIEIKQSTNIVLNMSNCSYFAIYKQDTSNNSIPFLLSLDDNAKFIKMNDEILYMVIYQEHSYIKGFFNNSSFSIIKNGKIQYSIYWKENQKEYNNTCILEIYKLGYKKIQLQNISDFSVFEISTEGKVTKIISNGSFEHQLSSPLSNIYVVAKQKTKRYAENLYFYKFNILLHFVKNIVPDFALVNKMNSNGSIMCKVYNSIDCNNYYDTSIVALKSNGNVVYLSNFALNEDVQITNNFIFIDNDDYINIYYYKKECLNFYLLNEYTNNADFKEILQNKFSDDISTINYHVKYKKDRYADIIFAYFTLDCRRYPILTAYNNGLYGIPAKSSFFGGSAIYGIPFADYYKGLSGKYKTLNIISQFFLTEAQRANFKEYVNKIYEKYELPVNYDVLPKLFTTNLVLEDELLDNLENYINYLLAEKIITIDYRNKKLYDNQKNLILDYKRIKDNITTNILISGKYNKKWKSEVELYNLVVKLYPDAIYQYHSRFLGHQSFDIFIPSQNIAIEYQGVQHYEPVDIFGGIEGLKNRVELDNRKRTICKLNNIKLIEWKYDISINKLNLEKFLKNVK